MVYFLICVHLCHLWWTNTKIQPLKRVVKHLGRFISTILILEGGFSKHIGEWRNSRRHVCLGHRERGEVTQYSVFSSLVCGYHPGDVICKEISISIIYNIIIYIDITFFLPFLMVSHKKVIQLNTEYWVTSMRIYQIELDSSIKSSTMNSQYLPFRHITSVRIVMINIFLNYLCGFPPCAHR